MLSKAVIQIKYCVVNMVGKKLEMQKRNQHLYDIVNLHFTFMKSEHLFRGVSVCHTAVFTILVKTG